MDLFSFPFNLSTCFWSYAQAFIRFMEKTKLLETKGLIVSKLDPIRIFFNTVLYIQMKSDYEIDKNFSCKKLESLKSTLRLTHGSKKFLFHATESDSRMPQISNTRKGGIISLAHICNCLTIQILIQMFILETQSEINQYKFTIYVQKQHQV